MSTTTENAGSSGNGQAFVNKHARSMKIEEIKEIVNSFPPGKERQAILALCEYTEGMERRIEALEGIPDDGVDVGIGYRRLSVGEEIPDGHEFWLQNDKTWVRLRTMAGDRISSRNCPCRVPLTTKHNDT